MSAEFIADFEADWIRIMRERLKAMGVKVEAGLDDSKVGFIYFAARNRRVPVARRKVVRAQEFICPPENEAGVEHLADLFEKGGDVNPWLSKTRLTTKSEHFHDGLLNAWGIQHFHLGLTPKKRGKNCLFAALRSNSVFFLDVLPHNQYTRRDLVIRIHNNWPELLQNCIFKGATPAKKDLKDEEVRALRDKNSNHALQMPDGTVYLPPGGGSMANGTSVLAVRDADYARTQVLEAQQRIQRGLHEFLTKLSQMGLSPADPPTFTLVVDDADELYAVEATARAQFRIMALFPKRE